MGGLFPHLLLIILLIVSLPLPPNSAEKQKHSHQVLIYWDNAKRFLRLP